jgi:hypothetical protein
MRQLMHLLAHSTCACAIFLQPTLPPAESSPTYKEGGFTCCVIVKVEARRLDKQRHWWAQCTWHHRNVWPLLQHADKPLSDQHLTGQIYKVGEEQAVALTYSRCTSVLMEHD